MENCQYCGQPQDQSVKDYTEYFCGTMEIQGEIARGDRCYESQIEQQADLLRQSLEALKAADKLFLRCHEWTKGDAQVMVPVQKLRLDIEEWAREYGALDELIEQGLEKTP